MKEIKEWKCEEIEVKFKEDNVRLSKKESKRVDRGDRGDNKDSSFKMGVRKDPK